MATPSCSIVVTGFGPFADVEENPTDWLARKLASGADGWRLPHGVPLRSAVLEVSTEDVDAQLQRLHSGDDSSGCVIYVHLGVDARGRGFALERTGVNNMTFRVADERGRQPTDEPIDAAPAARGVRGCRRSPLPLSSLRDALAARSAEEIRVSDDAGRCVGGRARNLSMSPPLWVRREADCLPTLAGRHRAAAAGMARRRRRPWPDLQVPVQLHAVRVAAALARA